MLSPNFNHPFFSSRHFCGRELKPDAPAAGIEVDTAGDLAAVHFQSADLICSAEFRRPSSGWALHQAGRRAGKMGGGGR